MPTRPPAVAGTWYPGTAAALVRDVDRHLQDAPDWTGGPIRAVIAPHAGLMFSGPVGAHAYKAASAGLYDTVVLAGPSHYVAFDGVAIYPRGAFATPLGDAEIDSTLAEALMASPVIRSMAAAHQREHSLEMQLPFVRHLFPEARIVPLVMGFQTRETIAALATALTQACTDNRILIVGSTDLSHFFDARTAQELDGRVARHVAAFDADGLLETFEHYPEHERGRFVACGGGPAIAVMMAARSLGATDARVLKYGHSGEISGDFGGVVGYLAAVFGTFAGTTEAG
jgi:AmmeMemoRadiSam system protein B